MESADPFYSYNFSGRKELCRFGDYFRGLSGDCLAGAVCQPNLRPPTPAGDRLSMKTAVIYIRILSGALAAHFKNRHSRIRPVVRNGLNDRIPRPAISAVYKRIAVAKILFVGHFHKAVPARGDIGGNL